MHCQKEWCNISLNIFSTWFVSRQSRFDFGSAYLLLDEIDFRLAAKRIIVGKLSAVRILVATDHKENVILFPEDIQSEISYKASSNEACSLISRCDKAIGTIYRLLLKQSFSHSNCIFCKSHKRATIKLISSVNLLSCLLDLLFRDQVIFAIQLDQLSFVTESTRRIPVKSNALRFYKPCNFD